MNISNDVLFKAVSAFVDAIAQGIKDEVVQDLNDRINELSDLVSTLQSEKKEFVTELIDSALYEYDPSDHLEVDDMIDNMNYSFHERVKDVIRELNFEVKMEVS